MLPKGGKLDVDASEINNTRVVHKVVEKNNGTHVYLCRPS